ncbi:MAG TPA: pyruvate, phosphate dikinase [Candidatus Omnitrophica bacterium]|nr:MAG: pyruvate, phosphate dikinase [Omnitrophica WOR_2 bacterium GWA2_53_43]HCI44507.1 pyruvate, phosphate dikinase [Candidatus Omnitrophota bacterium]
MAKKYVYSYGAGRAEAKGEVLSKNVLGGKGIGLMEMTSIGIPVPAGFTVTVQTCEEYYKLGRKLPKGLEKEVRDAVLKLEQVTGKKLGDKKDPLLVSVRSGAARSMPGMLETILNLGLNDESVEGLARKTGNPRFAYDAYRRFIQMYSSTAMGLSKQPMEDLLHEMKHELGVKTDPEIPAEKLKELCGQFKAFYRMNKSEDFPQDPWKQLWGAIMAVFNSWEAEKAQTYRRVEKITDLKGTAVNVVQMVFGNKGNNSGTGVCFTRDPNSGENIFYGDYLINAQGEDVVAGIRTPLKLSTLQQQMPRAYDQLCAVRAILESYYREMQDLEFTIEDEKLYMLQCRTGKRSPAAAFRIALDHATRPLLSKAQANDLVKKGYLPQKYAELAVKPVITKEQAVRRVSSDDIERLFYPVIDTNKVAPAQLKSARLASGINAVPGSAAGKVVFTAAEAEKMGHKGEKVILVRKETSPEDVGGMHAAKGILTATGGKTSHAAVVARGWGKCCIVGCEVLNINYEAKQMSVNGKTVKQGDYITLDGSAGEVYVGDMPLREPELPDAYYTILKWADEFRTINVRTNADTPYDAVNAIKMGAEGIGLCRTEHMFFDTEERRLAIQEMIVAETLDARTTALSKLLPFQTDDFYGIFKAMNGFPVTIRLIDPPLHEFTPKDNAGIEKLSKITGIAPDKIKHRCEQLHEANPMLGHRGCRLCITYPEILDMQVTAIIQAAIKCRREGIRVLPEIMHPLTIDKKEFRILEQQTRAVADRLIKQAGVTLPYLVGTMIEIPRAALLADQLAEVGEFFSFGTNDLTQMTLGLSRDDAGRFLPVYVATEKDGGKGIFKDDPFQSLDQEGVGMLVKMGIERGRSTKKNLKVGICGEHGGDAASVDFCCRVGMDYVSCSPYRVPIARLAAAQSALRTANGGKTKVRKEQKRSKKR